MAILPIRFHQGNCTSRPRDNLQEGEMQSSTGGYYRPGDTERLWKRGGRTLFGDASLAVLGIVFAAFDTGTDLILVLAGTFIKKAAAGLTGTFSNLVTGLNALTKTLSGCHYDDRWYLATGYDRNRVVESDGTARFMGMEAPQTALTATAGTVAVSVQRPTAETNGAGAQAFVNPGNARDTNAFSFAYGTLSAAGTKVCTWTTFGSDTSSGRVLSVKWRMTGAQSENAAPGDRVGDEGGTTDAGYLVNVLLEYSVNSGGAFSTLLSRTGMRAAMGTPEFVSVAVTANSNLIQLRATLTYTSGTSAGTLQIYDVKTQSGTAVTAFTTVTGLQYGVTEYDATRGLESPISPLTPLVTLSSQTVVTLTTFPTARNSNATHWRIYRNYDGGPVPATLGLLEAIPIAETTYVDTFERFDSVTPPVPLYRLLTVTVGNATLRFPLDTPPPALSHLNVFRGSIIGVRKDKVRSLSYSAAGFPESWPEVNVIEKFPMPEHDRLVATATVGDTLLVGAQDLMLTLPDLPRVLFGTLDASKAEPLRGQPGLIHQYALCTFSVEGEARAAWVSQYGVHETNGLEARRISGDIDWQALASTEVVTPTISLVWDPENLILIFTNANTAGRDMILFHMAPEHQKANGLPKWTGFHYAFTSCMVAGRLGAAGDTKRHVVWSGNTDANVYVENNGGIDDSQAYSGTIHPLIVQTGRIYGNRETFGLYRGSLRHSAWGAAQTLTLDGSIGRDAGTTQTVSKTVSLVTQKGEETLIARSGDWAEFTLTHTGNLGSSDRGNIGAIEDLRCDVRKMGKSGRIA